MICIAGALQEEKHHFPPFSGTLFTILEIVSMFNNKYHKMICTHVRAKAGSLCSSLSRCLCVGGNGYMDAVPGGWTVYSSSFLCECTKS